MTIKEPVSMDECIYFTNRSIGKGKVRAWVLRAPCPKCNKNLMGKPRDPKTGKPKIRAKIYVCPSCNHTVEKEEFEDTLEVQAKYTCPHCAKDGASSASFARKSVSRFNEEKQKKETVKAYRIPCEHCGENIDLTKKMK